MYCIFQQDGATSRTSKVTQEHLDEEVPEFIKKRRSRPIAILWIIMCMWDSLSEKVYRGRTEKFTKEELKQRITESWEEISLAELRKSSMCRHVGVTVLQATLGKRTAVN
jgi:hypothetical protein